MTTEAVDALIEFVAEYREREEMGSLAAERSASLWPDESAVIRELEGDSRRIGAQGGDHRLQVILLA